MNGIQRINHCFKQGKANIAYLTAGDGGMDCTFTAALALIAGGVNMLEIGVPFSDPVGDGPVIQRAALRALAAGTTLQEIVLLVQKIRQHSDIPLVLFSYFNPILAVLPTTFLQDAAEAGIDGMLMVDCPLEEALAIRKSCLQCDMAPIYLIAPTTSAARMTKLDHHGRGFLYYVCRKGITGVRKGLPADFVEKMRQIKSTVDLPVVVGFGISDREMAAQVLAEADGVVVGSLFVKAIEDGMKPAELTRLAQSIYPI